MASDKDHLVRLAHYLRRHPAAVNLPAAEVAADAQVPVEVVRAALRKVGQSSAPQSRVGAEFKLALRRSWAEFGAFLDREESNFLWFIALSIIIPLSMVIFIPSRNSGIGETVTTAVRIFFGSIFLLSVVVIHPVLMARYSKWSWVWKGAIVAWFSLWIVPTVETLLEPWKLENLAQVLGLLLVFAIVALLLTGLNSAAVLMSTYVRLKGEERRAASMTRQDLLQRLFEIEEALSLGGVPNAPRRTIPAWEWANENGMWVFPTLSFLLAFANTALVPEASLNNLNLLTVVLLFLGVLLLFVGVAAQVAFSYIGGDVVRALRNSYLFTLASFAATGVVWLIQEKLGFHFLRDLKVSPEWLQFNALTGFLMASFIGVFAGLAAFLRDRRSLEERLRQNDPQTLLSELVEIQRRLSPTQGLACVMVVDAARSSMMKANAQDAQVAEWSFRAYQQFLRDIIEAEGGLVHSVAGDGAVAMFQDASRAFHAARTVQTEIINFNQNVNRLRDPFRLRIGLHADVVAGDLNEVQFAAAIDIAAHVEKVSQVGGIAVTHAVAEALPDHRFAELADMVDDQIVLLSLNPTLDPE